MSNDDSGPPKLTLHQPEQHFSPEEILETLTISNRQFLKYWNDKKDKDNLTYSDFQPAHLPDKLWRKLFIALVEEDPLRFRFVYQGLYITDELHQNAIGKYLAADTFGENYKAIMDIYVKVVENKSPILSREITVSESKSRYMHEVIHAPLFDEFGNVSHVVGTIDRNKHDTESKGFHFTDQPTDQPRDWTVSEVFVLDEDYEISK
ncbi:MAG: PAS domain-containing protein [Alphaproteobacteria bacterium]|nr:PAS domain-containing protein [Alphaproteobacteria bacterium]